MRGNNTEGLLLNFPSFHSLERYKKDLFKSKQTFIDEVVNFVSRNSKCSSDDMIDCMVETFFNKQMDPISVEAMLCNANISTKKARKLFTHMSFFLEEVYLLLRRRGQFTLGIMTSHPT
jgi:hypothetical protein